MFYPKTGLPMIETLFSFSFIFVFIICATSGKPEADITQYMTLFKLKRADQLEAVKSLVDLNNYEKQYKMVKLLLQRMSEVMTENRLLLESSDYIPGSGLPSNETVRDALSQLLENTAFLGDMVLRLPEIMHSILEQDKQLKLLVFWSLAFTNSTQLCDVVTQKMLHLVAQELNLVERDPFYRNPYSSKSKIQVESLQTKPLKVKAKKKLKRGPQLGGSRHGEL